MRTHRIVSSPEWRSEHPLPPLPYGDQGRKIVGGDKPRITLFHGWAASGVSKGGKRTPQWLTAYRRVNHPGA